MHCILHDWDTYAPRLATSYTHDVPAQEVLCSSQPIALRLFLSFSPICRPLCSLLFFQPSPTSNGIPLGRSLRKFGHHFYSVKNSASSVSTGDRVNGRPIMQMNPVTVSAQLTQVSLVAPSQKSLFFSETSFFFVAFDLENFFGASIVSLIHPQAIQSSIAPSPDP